MRAMLRDKDKLGVQDRVKFEHREYFELLSCYSICLNLLGKVSKGGMRELTYLVYIS